MAFLRYAVAFGIAGFIAGCGSDASGPGSGAPGTGNLTEKVTDPAGDTFGSGTVRWDLTAMTVTRDTGGITVLLDFSSNLIAPTSGDADAMVGFVDIDADQDPTTGRVTAVDEFRPPNSGLTGMGMDYQIVLTTYAPDSTVAVKDSQGRLTGSVRPVFNGSHVTIRVPRALLGDDDGLLNAAAIAGTTGRPSDIIPEDGHLQLGGTGVGATSASRTPAAGEGARTLADGVSWTTR